VHLADEDGGRRSRHARTRARDTAIGRVFVKVYPTPAGWRARRAYRMGEVLSRCGFPAPEPLLCATRGREGILVTRDAAGEPLASIATLPRARKWTWLRRLGASIGALHDLGFVHGDLVPANILVRGDGFVWLDNDRTRRGHVLAWWGGWRNLVQLGRFVVPGISTADRMRVLCAYAHARGCRRTTRKRLARWLAHKTIARRCRIEDLDPVAVARAGFREAMRSGGPFDRAHGRSPA